MESSAIAVLVPPVTTQNGALAAETQTASGSDGAPSLFSRMLSGTTGTSQQLTGSVPADTALQMMIHVPVQFSAEEGVQQAIPAVAANDSRPLLSDGGVLSTLLAFQAAPSPRPENGEVPQTTVEPGETVKVPILVSTVRNDTGETIEVQESPEKVSGEDQKASDASLGTTEFLLASAMQITPQQLSLSQPQKRPDVTDAKVQVVPEAVTSGGTPAIAQAQVQLDPLQKAGTSAQSPVDNKVEPAPQIQAASLAGIVKSTDKDVTAANSVGTDRETLSVDGEERSALVGQVAGKFQKSALRRGHDQVATQKGEVPAPVTGSQVFDRPLLEVVVEDAGTEQSAELAAKPAKVDTSTDVAVVGKSPHTLIGGAGVTKAEPTESSAVGEVVRSSSHEQIMAQVKEQIGKAEFRADDGRVVLRLHPEELGSLRIDVKMDDQKLRLHIVAENPTVRDALVANMDSLKESLSKQQIVMERFDVATGQGQGQQQLYREHRQQVQDGQVNRTNRPVTEYAEDGEVVNRQAMNAYWAPQDSSLLNVRF